MGVDAKWGRFSICPEMSRFVPVCPSLSSFVPICPRSGLQEGQQRTNGDRTRHFGDKSSRTKRGLHKRGIHEKVKFPQF